MAGITRIAWSKSFLHYGSFRVEKRRLWAMVAWTSAEGSNARFNPLACTAKRPGSTPFNWNGGFPVQNYTSEEQGLEAILDTLHKGAAEHGYQAILDALSADRTTAKAILEGVEESDWGTGGLALEILDDVKHAWHLYGDRLIGQ